MVEVGQEARLTCLSPSSSPWLLCTWSLTSHLHCALLAGDEVLRLDCEGEEEAAGLQVNETEISVEGDRGRCCLVVAGVARQSAGVWTCSLSSLQSGQLVTSHTAHTELQVTSRGSLALVLHGQTEESRDGLEWVMTIILSFMSTM